MICKNFVRVLQDTILILALGFYFWLCIWLGICFNFLSLSVDTSPLLLS